VPEAASLGGGLVPLTEPSPACTLDNTLSEESIHEEASLRRLTTSTLAGVLAPVDSLTEEEGSLGAMAKCCNRFETGSKMQACVDRSAGYSPHEPKQNVIKAYRVQKGSRNSLRGCQGSTTSTTETCLWTESSPCRLQKARSRSEPLVHKTRALCDIAALDMVESRIELGPGAAAGGPVMRATAGNSDVVQRPPVSSSQEIPAVTHMACCSSDFSKPGIQHVSSVANESAGMKVDARPWAPGWLNRPQLPEPLHIEDFQKSQARLAGPDELGPVRVRHQGEWRPSKGRVADRSKGPVTGVLARLLQRAAEVGRMVRLDMRH
jgi:hypothetical protein